MKIIDYTILEQPGLDRLVGEVKEYINDEGWQPLGGISQTYSPDGTYFYAQSMVKYEGDVV